MTFDDIERLIADDDAVTVLFGKSIIGGYRTATLMTKGRGDWIKGKGQTVRDAFADMMSQIETARPRPYEYDTKPVTEIVTRGVMPL